ncbi:MAG: glycosyltransferase family 4 protein [Hyphomicrobiaceae bacterium]
MKIAFYAPMKSPRHPVPSGDRLMARQLTQVLELIGAEVRLASEVRTYINTPDAVSLDEQRGACAREARRLIQDWEAQGWRPDVWFCYHPYYKALDWIGPAIVAHFGAVHVTAEASYAPGRRDGPWKDRVEELAGQLTSADCHFYLKDRDRAGLAQLEGLRAGLVHVPPFIDIEPFAELDHARTAHGPVRLVTVAMMRRDVKLESYRYLARALGPIQHLDWELDIAGDGDARGDVEDAFRDFDADRVRFLGRLEGDGIRSLLAGADLFVWPGFGEAYGLAYLEAQAAGLAVVAQDTAGVANVVQDGVTGLLCPAHDVAAFTATVQRFVDDRQLLRDFGARARAFILTERSHERACSIIGRTLAELIEQQ